MGKSGEENEGLRPRYAWTESSDIFHVYRCIAPVIWVCFHAFYGWLCRRPRLPTPLHAPPARRGSTLGSAPEQGGERPRAAWTGRAGWGRVAPPGGALGRKPREGRLWKAGGIYLMLACVFTAVAAVAWAEGPPSPALGIIPANASLVVATVLTRTVWAPGTLLGSRPPLPPDRTWYSIRLQIESVTQARPDLPSMAEPGVIEAFSGEPLSSELLGSRVEARLEFVGDTRATRWWVADIRVVSPQR